VLGFDVFTQFHDFWHPAGEVPRFFLTFFGHLFAIHVVEGFQNDQWSGSDPIFCMLSMCQKDVEYSNESSVRCKISLFSGLAKKGVAIELSTSCVPDVIVLV